MITSTVDPMGASNPLLKTVVEDSGAWFANYRSHPWLLIAPAFGVLGAAGALLGLRARREIATILSSALSIFGIISTVGVSMFPFILPSSLDPRFEPDGMGRIIKPSDAFHHAGRHGDLHSADRRIHELGLQTSFGAKSTMTSINDESGHAY